MQTDPEPSGSSYLSACFCDSGPPRLGDRISYTLLRSLERKMERFSVPAGVTDVPLAYDDYLSFGEILTYLDLLKTACESSRLGFSRFMFSSLFFISGFWMDRGDRLILPRECLRNLLDVYVYKGILNFLYSGYYLSSFYAVLVGIVYEHGIFSNLFKKYYSELLEPLFNSMGADIDPEKRKLAISFVKAISSECLGCSIDVGTDCGGETDCKEEISKFLNVGYYRNDVTFRTRYAPCMFDSKWKCLVRRVLLEYAPEIGSWDVFLDMLEISFGLGLFFFDERFWNVPHGSVPLICKAFSRWLGDRGERLDALVKRLSRSILTEGDCAARLTALSNLIRLYNLGLACNMYLGKRFAHEILRMLEKEDREAGFDGWYLFFLYPFLDFDALRDRDNLHIYLHYLLEDAGLRDRDDFRRVVTELSIRGVDVQRLASGREWGRINKPLEKFLAFWECLLWW